MTHPKDVEICVILATSFCPCPCYGPCSLVKYMLFHEPNNFSPQTQTSYLLALRVKGAEIQTTSWAVA